MKGLATISLLFALSAILVTVSDAREEPAVENSLVRLVREAAKKQECRYDKEAWEECDLTTGLQRRALKLKASARSAPSVECEATKYLTRPCKKACRYAKGTWTECVNGARSRVDQLKLSSAGCEQTREVTRRCKSVCRYSKSEWSPCDNGVKTKSLTLIEGEAADCEQSKVISKQCAEQSKSRAKPGKQRGRKNQPRND